MFDETAHFQATFVTIVRPQWAASARIEGMLFRDCALTANTCVFCCKINILQ